MPKSDLGPGYLKDLEKSFYRSSHIRKTPNPVTPKAEVQSEFVKKAKSKSYVPGVGAYKDSERAYTSNTVLRKARVPYISKYKFTRFTEAVSKEKSWVPGPGSYDIVPFAKKDKR